MAIAGETRMNVDRRSHEDRRMENEFFAMKSWQ
jgi:hypothetical protein